MNKDSGLSSGGLLGRNDQREYGIFIVNKRRERR